MPRQDFLVDLDWLAANLDDTDLVIVDTRFSLPKPDQGRNEYLAGHIPGAVYCDLNQDMSSSVQTHGGRHPLPDWNAFAKRLGELGIGSSSKVVVYDDSRFAFAARLWWMLRYLGHGWVRLLDGGIRAWESAGRPMAAGMQNMEGIEETRFVPQVQGDWLVDREDVQRQLKAGELVIDSRSPERWRGEVEPIDPIAGSVSGSVNTFWKQVSTDEGYLLNEAALKQHWESILTAQKERAIVYCGSGVTACVNLFSMQAAGYPMARLYPGGWSDWCSYLTVAETTEE